MSDRGPRLCALFDEIASRVGTASLRTIGFTGAVLDEGASTLALGTALSLAALEESPVLLVDANWPRPSLTADAGATARPGLSDALRGVVQLDRAVLPTGRRGLAFLPAGSSAGSRPSLDDLGGFLDAALGRYRTVVVDLPPALAEESVVLAWAASLQQLFVVVRNGVTPLALVRRAIDEVALEQPQVVLNRTNATAIPAAPQRAAVI